MSTSATNIPTTGSVTVNKLNTTTTKPVDEDINITDLTDEEKKLNNPVKNTPSTGPAAGSNLNKALNVDVPDEDEMEDMDEKPASKPAATTTPTNPNNDAAPVSSSTSTSQNKELKDVNESEFPSSSKPSTDVVLGSSAVRNNTNVAEKKVEEPETKDEEPAEKSTADEEPTKAVNTLPPLIRAPKRTAKKSTKHSDIRTLKAAHLLINQATGNLKIKADDTEKPTIVKLIQPVNKANIKLKTFKTKYEREYERMRKMSTDELLALKSKLESIEFDEVANTNIINGLLELVDDHHLKQLTIEKMLKMGDITINF